MCMSKELKYDALVFDYYYLISCIYHCNFNSFCFSSPPRVGGIIFFSCRLFCPGLDVETQNNLSKEVSKKRMNNGMLLLYPNE